jgi:cell wall-associated NlpC family hydrolase
MAAQPVAEGWIDPATGQWVDATTQAAAPATDGWIDPATGQWVAAQAEGWIDPNTGLWVDPNAAATAPNEVALYQEAVDLAAAPVDPAAVATDPAAMPADVAVVPETTETWTEAPVAEIPITDGWVEPIQDPAAVPVEAAPVVEDTWTEPVATDYVVEAPATDQWVEPAPVDTASNDSWSDPIGTAYIAGSGGDGAACRVSAERGSDKIAVLGEGEAVEVRGEAIGEWQPVNCSGMGGYVNTAFIAWQPAANDGGGRRNRTSSVGDGGTVTSNGDGQSMVNFAMQYVGYPYAYAGEGPYAFDCSGFTKFVAMNALGIDITHDMFTQIGMGQSIDQGSLQPGDLVFFANTFRPGLSHVGIYVGGGQFVHSENESTGVVVSDLNSDYYGSRWAGGTRLA